MLNKSDFDVCIDYDAGLCLQCSRSHSLSPETDTHAHTHTQIHICFDAARQWENLALLGFLDLVYVDGFELHVGLLAAE